MNRLLPRVVRQSGARSLVPLALVVAQSVAIVWVGWAGGFSALVGRLERSEPALPSATSLKEWQAAVARDPHPGLLLPHTVIGDDLGGRLAIGAARRPTGLFFINSCTECVADSVKVWDRLQRVHPEADLRVVPGSVDPERIRQYRRSHHLAVPFVTRGGGDLHRACNAYFLPRAYVLDPHGRLVYLQPPSVATEAALAAAARALEALSPATHRAEHSADGPTPSGKTSPTESNSRSRA